MALPSSGQLSLGDIATEQSVTLSNVSLRSMSNTAGFTSPDSVSEFYGYSAAPVVCNNDYALDFDGVNDYVRGSITGSIPNRTFTVSMWVRIDATTKHNMSFYAWCGTEGSIANDRFLIYYAASVNRLIVQFRRGSDAAQYIQAYPLHSSSNATATGITNSGTGWVASQRGNTDSDGFTHLCFAIDQTISSASNGIKTYWN